MAEPPASAVGALLNAAQDASAAAERAAAGLWQQLLAQTDAAYDALEACVDHLVATSQKSLHVERCVRFFAVFGAKAPPASEVALVVVESLLERLGGHAGAADKAARLRACQLLQQLLSGLPEGLLLDGEVLQGLAASLIERLQDKLPAVRAEAARAVGHLATGEAGTEIAEALVELLEADKSKDVRVAVVHALPLDADTLPQLLRRACDVNPLVRKAVVARLKGLSMRLLSIEQRASVIQQLLQDRDSAVADAAAALLVHWLSSDCAGDPLQLLQLLDVETYADAAVCALESLIASDAISSPGSADDHSDASSSGGGAAIAYVEAAAKAAAPHGGLVGLRVLAAPGSSQLLEPHEALMWRCLCEWLRTDAISRGLAAASTGGARAAVQAAAAARRHEVLERALPASASDMMQLVLRHTAAGPPARFAAAQLLHIAATCVEWTDAASRDAAAPALQQLLALSPVAEADEADAGPGGASARGRDGPVGLQLAGNGGAGEFEAAVVQLVLAVQGSGGHAFALALLDGIAGLAAAAGLLRKPLPDEERAACEPAFSVSVAEPCQVLQCLAYVRLLLQHLPGGRHGVPEHGGISFASLWELLLLLALKQEHPAIRAQAVECIGLFALASASSNAGLLGSAVALQGTLLAASGCAATRRAAACSLTDIGLIFGPAAVDAALRRPGAAAAVQQDAGRAGNEGAAAAAACLGSGMGLLELLLEQAEALLAEAQPSGAARGRAKRSAGARAAADASSLTLPPAAAELLAVVAECLAKLLLHQRSWLRQYPDDSSGSPLQAASQGGSHAAGAALAPDSRRQQAGLLKRAAGLLLQLQFHPATEASPQLRQCLSVFFEAFACAAEEHRLQLVAACLPAARQALHLACKRQPAALLVKFVLQLLQQAALRQAAAAADAGEAGAACGAARTQLGEGWESLALTLLGEVELVEPITVRAGVQPAKFKPYLSALLKLVCELPLQPGRCEPRDWAVLLALSERLALGVRDATLGKDVAALQARLEQLADDAGSSLAAGQLAPEALEQLICSIQRLELAPLPGAAGEAAAAPRASRKPAGAGRPRGAAAAASGGAAPAARRASTRAASAAARRRVAAVSSSEGEEDEQTASGSSSDGDLPAAAQHGAAAAAAGSGSGDEADATASSEADEPAAAPAPAPVGRTPAAQQARPVPAAEAEEEDEHSEEEAFVSADEREASASPASRRSLGGAAASTGKRAISAAPRSSPGTAAGAPRQPLAPSSLVNRGPQG